jgi:hypothetical protein
VYNIPIFDYPIINIAAARLKKLILIISLVLTNLCLAQQEDSIEIFLIDSYVTPETPYKFIVSFFTSLPAKSTLIIDKTYQYDVSTELTEQHKTAIDIGELRFQSKTVPFVILVEDSLGRKNHSELYEFEMPQETIVEGGSDLFTLCLFGGTIFLLPSPVYVIADEQSYFSLTKEIPIVFIRSAGIGYPTGYFALEYSYIFNAPKKSFLRLGYKHLMEVPGIEYISPGVNGFTDFLGYNGISPELSLGLFRIADVFTFYTRYRYNFKPGDTYTFHEITIGLYSGFFALYF